MTSHTLLTTLIISGLVTGCISSNNSTGAAPFGLGSVATQSSAISLSGAILLGDVTTALNNPSTAPLKGAAMAGMIVTAVDEFGNTRTTNSDNSGSFSFSGLKPNTNYSLIFIDRRSLKVVASLVGQASGSTGALNLSGNTNLKSVLIDPASGKAITEAELQGDLTLGDGGQFDSNQDGSFDNDDATALQASSLQGANGKLTSISLANYMGEPGSWSINFQLYAHDTDTACSWVERQIHVVRSREVNGPQGKQVQALKRGYVHYFDGEIGDFCFGPLGGYYDETMGSDPLVDWGYPDANIALTAPPLQYNPENGLWGAASYTFIDTLGGHILLGDRDSGSNVVWGDAAGQPTLPLNAELGIEVVVANENWNGLNFVESFQVDMATNPDGSAAIVTDAQGLKLPVILLTRTYRETDDNDPAWGFTEREQFYLLAKYGVQVPANNRWDLAMSQTRFGLIRADGSLVDATPTRFGAVTIDPVAKPFPDAPVNASLLTLNALRASWVGFVDANLRGLDAYTRSNQQLIAESDYLWVDDDVAPASWDASSYEDYHFIAGSLLRNDGVDFSASGFSLPVVIHSTATAHLEWQAWDEVNQSMVTLQRSAALQMNFADPLCDPTLSECNVVLQARTGFTFPAFNSVAALTTPWSSDVWDGTTFVTRQVVDVGLVLVLDDGFGGTLYDEVVEWYNLIP